METTLVQDSSSANAHGPLLSTRCPFVRRGQDWEPRSLLQNKTTKKCCSELHSWLVWRLRKGHTLRLVRSAQLVVRLLEHPRKHRKRLNELFYGVGRTLTHGNEQLYGRHGAHRRRGALAGGPYRWIEAGRWRRVRV